MRTYIYCSPCLKVKKFTKKKKKNCFSIYSNIFFFCRTIRLVLERQSDRGLLQEDLEVGIIIIIINMFICLSFYFWESNYMGTYMGKRNRATVLYTLALVRPN